MDDKTFERKLTRTLDAVMRALMSGDPPLHPSDQTIVLEAAWLSVARTARDCAVTLPGGFPEELAAQLDRLRGMAEQIADEVPDPELERMHHEGDHVGLKELIARRMGGA